MALQTQSVSLNRPVNSLQSLLAHSLGDHIQIHTPFADNLVPVLGDASQIENALLNLALNARDAMPEEVMEHVFEPYFSTKVLGEGTGLPIVCGFARHSGGHVALCSTPGKVNKELQIVLSDAIMPGGMSGFEVLDQAMAPNPALKVMVITGYSGAVDAMSGRSPAQQYKVLRKPYSLDELARALSELLQ